MSEIKTTRMNIGTGLKCVSLLQVGNRSDSNVYINAKLKKAKEIGADGKLIKLPDTITQGDLKREIMALNHDNDIDGIIIQVRSELQ